MRRVLVATRGAVARHLLRVYAREDEVETVSVYSEPDVEQPWVDEATYSVYLNGAAVKDTYLHPMRVVGAAIDAGCDAIHPGDGPLAERLDLHSLARGANLPVVGTDPRILVRVHDRVELDKLARAHNIPMIPSTSDVPESHEGLSENRKLGYPLWVKASAGGVAERCDRPDDLDATIARARAAAEVVAGDRRVYLQQHLAGMRTVSAVVVGDRKGDRVFLGCFADTHQEGGIALVVEMGPAILPAPLATRLGQWALALAKDLGWSGVGCVRFALSPTGSAFLLGVSPSLPPAWPLLEEMLGVELVPTQLRIERGERLGWEHYDIALERHGLLLRLVHVADDGSRPEGTVERVSIPEGVRCERAVEVGSACTPDTDPLVAVLVVTAPTRQAALVRARGVLEAVRIEGVATNQAALLALLSDEGFWRGDAESRVVTPKETFEA